MDTAGRLISVNANGEHTFSKHAAGEIELVAGVGVIGDAHAGARVRHRSRVARDPDQPNLRQVHLVDTSLFDELAAAGRHVGPGDLGENLTTEGLDLLGLPTGSLLAIGSTVLLALTGCRNPCGQINGFQSGLLDVVLGRAPLGSPRRSVGPMAVVVSGGTVRPGDEIRIALPPEPHLALERV